jgi:hypothetical protein
MMKDAIAMYEYTCGQAHVGSTCHNQADCLPRHGVRQPALGMHLLLLHHRYCTGRQACRHCLTTQYGSASYICCFP